VGARVQVEEILVKCLICKQGEPSPGRTTVTLQRGETTVIIKGVPADICEDCGEYYLADEIAERVLALAEQAVEHGAEVEILRFAA
jgi:YgiT-type zinc finger domain-containing protein